MWTVDDIETQKTTPKGRLFLCSWIPSGPNDNDDDGVVAAPGRHQG